MPNTLAHIGIQGPLNSLLLKGINPQWMLLGCVIPDIPWITQRILTLVPGIEPITLRLYSLNQASLFFCLFLAAALALAGSRPLPIFLLLSLNSFLHLLIDATQIKWANGVQLLVPFSWSLLRFDWFWPEHRVYLAATVGGLLFLALSWRKMAATDLQIGQPPAGKKAIILCLLLCYSAGPFLFFQQALEADNHFCQTLTNREERIGKEIELDRVPFSAADKKVRAFTKELLTLQGPLPETSGPLSVQGYFVDPTTIQVTAYHQHNQYRAMAASLGLLLIAALWAHCLIRRKFHHQPSTPQQGALP